jgi:acetoin utilization protein AcuB
MVDYYINHKQDEKLHSPITEIMKTKVLTATTETIISQIAAVFFQQRIGAMPIMQEEKLAGMITRSDILGAVVYSQPMESWV